MENSNRIIRRIELSKILGISRSTIYLRVSRKELSAPIRLGGEKSRAVGWLKSDVDNYLENLVAASKNGGAE